ncbi:MAG TPA: leucyl aminopeptidase [Candidatus Deferrimicrobiaceae bacterium]|nr:leucyl aminopeptidase [Candidatus Deferrimicrobiaceae bacterium]
MKTELVVGDIRKHRAGMLVVNLFEGTSKPGGATGAVDKAIGGAISAAIRDGDFQGKWGETLFLRPGGGVLSPRVLVVGLGPKEKFTLDRVRQSALPVMRMAMKKKITTVASVLHGGGAGGLDPEEAARFLGLGAVLSGFEYDRYKSEKEGRVTRFQLVEANRDASRRIARGLACGAKLGEAINWGRTLVASPPGDLRPDALARAARSLSGGKIRVKVYGRKEAEAWKMGGLLAVGKGSEVSPRLIVAEYRGGRPGGPWAALVGKGVTFDTGGISLKKWEGMEKMKYDMAGGAGMLATVRAAAALGMRRNIVAIVPAVENMPSGNAYRPGDVLRMMSGKTVEVLSTDAEGRLILADAITFARKRYRPEVLLDAATLTGACVVALGSLTMGMMGNDATLLKRMREASEASGERAWELPLHEEYFEQIKSEIADLKNIGGPEGGAITAGSFLKEFAGETPWVHMDIAGVAWMEKEKLGYAPGPTGVPVRLLVEFLRGGREGA